MFRIVHRLLIQYQKKHTQILRQYQWCTEMVLNIQFCTLSPQLHPELLDREVPLLETRTERASYFVNYGLWTVRF